MAERKKLVLIVANETGRIRWNDLEINPSTFIATFLLGAKEYLTRKPNSSFEADMEVTERIQEESDEEMFDPLRKIELRKRGLVVGSTIVYGDLKYFRNKKTGEGGYCFVLDNNQLQQLGRAGIEYKLLEDR